MSSVRTPLRFENLSVLLEARSLRALNRTDNLKLIKKRHITYIIENATIIYFSFIILDVLVR